MKVNRRNAPLGHHAPGAHSSTARGPINCQQIDIGIAGPADGHGQFSHRIGSGLEGNAFGAQLAQALHLVHEAFLIHETEARMPFKLLQRSGLKSSLMRRVFRIRCYDVTSFFQFNGALQRVHFDFSSDTFGSLAPL